MKRRAALVLSSLVVLTVFCEGLSHWRNAETFRHALRCGMTEEEVDSLSRQLGGSSVKSSPSNRFGDHVVEKGGTTFWFHFSNGRLESFREGQHFGVTGLRTSVMRNLCTRQDTAEVTVQLFGPSELTGAELSIDGRPWGSVGDLSTGMTIHGLPDGNHEIVISKAGYAPIRKPYEHHSNDYWTNEATIRLTISRSELRTL